MKNNHKYLSKYRQKDNRSSTEENRQIKNESTAPTHAKDRFHNFSENNKFKSLKILSFSYFQIAIIIGLIISILLPVYFVTSTMVDLSNEIISIQNFAFGKSLTASTSTVFIKCLIALCATNSVFNYPQTFVNNSLVEGIIRDMSDFPEIANFWDNEYLLNACLVVTNNTNSTTYINCMNDVIIQSANNTDSLLKLLSETVATIQKDIQMKSGQSYKLTAQNISVLFANPLEFESSYFNSLEYVFYNYITPLNDNFAVVVQLAMTNYLSSRKIIIIILICIFGLSMLLTSIYIAFIFTDKLIHLLSVSRCILRIIPTNVINNTQELETWIENKY